MDCPRCFYLDRRLGIARPPGFPFNLNSAVDALLKREFDRYRAQGVAHPMMPVARRGWFVYCNARRDLAAFDARLQFRIKLIARDGGDAWVEGTLAAIHEILRAPERPAVSGECAYCRYAARWAGA